MSTSAFFVTVLLAVVLLVAVSSVVAYRLGLRSGRSSAALAEADRQAAVDAAVRAILVERRATAEVVAGERERTVTAAVDTVVKVAGSAFDERLRSGTRHIELRADAFEQQTKHLHEELARMRDLVGTLMQDAAEKHGEVVNRLEHTVSAATTLAQTTQNLREALASPKHRGQWGERMADDVLRAAGFVEGVNYRRQTTISGGTRPDVTFLLPEGLELNMDVKFPIDNYLRYLDATTDADREAACTAFLRDVRARVKEITTRDYIDPARTVDQVLLFIPNESVYTFIHQNDPDLLDKALAQRVVLCSPSTLFAVLAVVRHAVRNFLFERTSGEILECLTRFVKQWDKFSDGVDKVHKNLDALSRSFDELNGTRRRMLEKEMDRIEVLQTRHEGEAAVGPQLATAEAPHGVRALRAG
jgi:DNA recombination protein RmuC